MRDEPSQAYWLSPDLKRVLDAVPGGATSFVKTYEKNGRTVAISFLRLSPQALKATTEWLRQRRNEVLVHRSVREIAEILDRVAEKWLTKSYAPRVEAIRKI